jgi:hypothetical protein
MDGNDIYSQIHYSASTSVWCSVYVLVRNSVLDSVNNSVWDSVDLSVWSSVDFTINEYEWK